MASFIKPFSDFVEYVFSMSAAEKRREMERVLIVQRPQDRECIALGVEDGKTRLRISRDFCGQSVVRPGFGLNSVCDALERFEVPCNAIRH